MNDALQIQKQQQQQREVNVSALESTSDGYAEDILYALYVVFRAKEKENEKKGGNGAIWLQACHQNRFFSETLVPKPVKLFKLIWFK